MKKNYAEYVRNNDGVLVAPSYEVAIQTNVQGSTEDDFETTENRYALSYRDASKMAISLSKEHNGRICVVCFFEDECSSYNVVWKEYYINGKKNKRV